MLKWGNKTSNDVADLNSTPCIPAHMPPAQAEREAALLGHQPAHADANEMSARERRAHGIRCPPLKDLENCNKPLSWTDARHALFYAGGRRLHAL